MYLLEDDEIGKAKQNKKNINRKGVSCPDSKLTYKNWHNFPYIQNNQLKKSVEKNPTSSNTKNLSRYQEKKKTSGKCSSTICRKLIL